MPNMYRMFALGLAFVFLAACGSGSDSTETAASSSTTEGQTVDSVDSGDDADEDHGEGDDTDEDHDEGDEGHDEGDEGHEGDDHDDDDHDDSGETRGLGAHEHGSAEMAVASSGSNLIIDLVSPTNNIFGFETEATTDEDKEIVEDRTEALSSPSIMTINPEAGCESSGAVTTDVVFEGSHAEITASWEFVCENPDQLEQLDTAGLFSEFPDLLDIDAEVASESGQTSAELSPSSATLALN